MKLNAGAVSSKENIFSNTKKIKTCVNEKKKSDHLKAMCDNGQRYSNNNNNEHIRM